MKIKVVILLLISVLMTACGREDYGKKQWGELNTVAVSEEIRVNNSEDLESFEEENKSITNTTEEEGGEYQTEQQYSNASICFEYPAEWELEEHQGEDGCCVRISAPNEEDGTAFELVQGEAWRVNYDYTKEDYSLKIYHLEMRDDTVEHFNEDLDFLEGYLERPDQTPHYYYIEEGEVVAQQMGYTSLNPDRFWEWAESIGIE